MKKVNKEKLEQILKDLEEEKSHERKVVLITGCRTNGTTDLALGNICSDPLCTSCNNFIKAIKKAAKEWKIN